MKPTLLSMIILAFIIAMFFYLTTGYTKQFEFKAMARGYSVHDLSRQDLWPEKKWKIRKRGMVTKN